MTKVVDAQLQKVNDKSTSLQEAQREAGNNKKGATGDQQAATTKAQQDFNVAIQEFSALTQAVNTAIKTIGESLSSMARKQ
jgi:Skp family chaperone for outer membrane proteins